MLKMTCPPYSSDQLYEAAELLNEKPTLINKGCFIKLLIDDAVFRFRNKLHKSPSIINLNYEEARALHAFLCDTKMPPRPNITVQGDAQHKDVLDCIIKVHGAEVQINNKSQLLE